MHDHNAHKSRKWARFIQSVMEANAITQQELARRLHCTQGQVQSRISGPYGRAPEGKEIDRWAKALQLTGDMAERFRELSDLDRASPALAQRLDDLGARLSRTEAARDRLAQERKHLKEYADVLESRINALELELRQALA